MGVDLYLDPASGDLAIADGDYRTVAGIDCLRQNLACGFAAGYGEWGAELMAGSGVAAAVEMSGPYFEPTVRAKVRQVCRWDGRVDMDSLEFEFRYSAVDGAFERADVTLFANAGAVDTPLVLPLVERGGRGA